MSISVLLYSFQTLNNHLWEKKMHSKLIFSISSIIFSPLFKHLMLPCFGEDFEALPKSIMYYFTFFSKSFEKHKYIQKNLKSLLHRKADPEDKGHFKWRKGLK